MSGRVLIVDDLEPNRRLLKDKLEAEYLDVLAVDSGKAALDATNTERPDLILLDVMMPGMDGFETCRRLKADPKTRHVPVVMVTALGDKEDRVKGLDAGADDFLTKPVDDVALLARVRSLLRLKVVIDELRCREASGLAIGAIERERMTSSEGGRVLIIDNDARQRDRIIKRLNMAGREAFAESDPKTAVERARGAVDLVIVDLGSDAFDALRLCARIRADELTRHVPILAIADGAVSDQAVRALDLGVNDILVGPVDSQELAARVRTQIKHKRYADFLRQTLDSSLEMAVTDQLTGLNNRRFMMGRLKAACDRASRGGPKVAVMISDIDYFKKVNDTYGHDIGDAVLKEFAQRLGSNVRAVDLPCRYGGEEFVVVMPETGLDFARQAAERVRRAICATPFDLPGRSEALAVTVSLGVAEYEDVEETPDKLLKKADEALYRAKQTGRNRVIAARIRRKPDAERQAS